MRTTLLLALVAVAAAACSSNDGEPPAQVAGTYTLTVTDGQNGCSVMNFTTGASQSGIVITVTQNGSALSATVTGVSGLVLAVATGNTLSGSIVGSDAQLTSSANHVQGGCAYATTATANISFLANGQVKGAMLYQDSGNGSADCGVMQQCTSNQTFTGTRTPGT
jgi:hypothetical protein